MRAHINQRDFEKLSAYLDGQLAPSERKKLEERMRARPELRTALEEMDRTRALLRMAPRRRAPRNFTLTPAMVGADRPAKRQPGRFPSLFPALSFASAIATLALVVSFLVSSPLPRPEMTTMMEPQSPVAEEGYRVFRTEEAAEEPAAGAAEEAEDSASGTFAVPEMPAAPQGDQAPEIAQAPPAANDAQADDTGPIITWGFPDVGGMGGGNEGLGGGTGGSGMGEIIVPPQGVESLQDGDFSERSAPSGELESELESKTIDSGPILGLPPTELAGQIIGRSGAVREEAQLPAPADGQSESAPQYESAPQPEGGEQPEAVQPPQAMARLLGLPVLCVIQGLLGLLALVTGVAAFILWRRSKI